MHDQRVVRRSRFRLKDIFNCRFIEYIGSESINRFGRKRDNRAAADEFGGFFGRVGDKVFTQRLLYEAAIFRNP